MSAGESASGGATALADGVRVALTGSSILLAGALLVTVVVILPPPGRPCPRARDDRSPGMSASTPRTAVGRRSVLQWAAVAGLALPVAACSREVAPAPTSSLRGGETSPTAERPRILLAYFSRAGENYFDGGRVDLEVGNTAVVARMVAELADVDLHEIRVADPYPHDYEETVERNLREQEDDARPAIDGAVPDLGDTAPSSSAALCGTSGRRW